MDKYSVLLWTNNIAAIMWIHTDLHKSKVYVAHRLKKIRENSEPHNWNHVRSEENPADSISLGIAPKDIVNNHLWRNGPSWIRTPQELWPEPLDVCRFETPSEVTIEYKVNTVQSVSKAAYESTSKTMPFERILVFIAKTRRNSTRFAQKNENRFRHRLFAIS